MQTKKSRSPFRTMFKVLLHPASIALALTWVAAALILIIYGGESLPVTMIGETGIAHVGYFFSLIVVALLQLGIIFQLTIKRPLPDYEKRVPDRQKAIRETVVLWIYALIVLIVLGAGFDIGLHLPGTILAPEIDLSSNYVLTWAAVNFLLFAVIPYIVFRIRGYNHEQLGLKSHNWRNDLLVLLVILILETIVELFGIPDGFRFFSLTATQMSIGGLVTLLVHVVGTGLPIMIFIQSILVPRYYRISGSAVGTVIAGGISYATFHIFEFWTVYQSLDTALFSLIFVYMQFTGAGMIKAMMTLRTGNAWLHMWGYHVIAPHIITDTPLVVNAFDIR